MGKRSPSLKCLGSEFKSFQSEHKALKDMHQYANHPIGAPNKVFVAKLCQDTYGMFNTDIQESARSNSEVKNVKEYLTERPGSRPVTNESSRKTFYS